MTPVPKRTSSLMLSRASLSASSKSAGRRFTVDTVKRGRVRPEIKAGKTASKLTSSGFGRSGDVQVRKYSASHGSSYCCSAGAVAVRFGAPSMMFASPSVSVFLGDMREVATVIDRDWLTVSRKGSEGARGRFLWVFEEMLTGFWRGKGTGGLELNGSDRDRECMADNELSFERRNCWLWREV